MCAGREICKCHCEPNEGNSELQKEQTLSAQVGREAEEKHQGGQTAMKSPMLPASVEIGTANCPNPEQVLIPPKRGDTAKASPNVKWHLLNTRRGECFHASVPGDLCGPSRSAKPRLSPRLSSVFELLFDAGPDFPVIPRLSLRYTLRANNKNVR
ncbi:hypothetical protein CesoFtcFv8_027782 [Champsocephalus esox]|uniref:Uncharacterized protein n=1 Tax=Champsocephalus esox TaxID=159716 RepID=A0AAN8AZ18_9TELE|nr:hypothetical protein CesoFtcFv8_027782 [Champsocephalus esox]